MAKKNAKEIIMERVLEAIKENKRVPWSSGVLNGEFLPYNWKKQRNYHGLNRFWLAMLFGDKEGSRCEFATFNQISEAGGKVKKGEHPTPVLFYYWWDKERKCCKDEESNPDDCMLLSKYYSVYEINTQAEGICSKRVIRERPNIPIEKIEEYVRIFAEKTHLKIEHKTGGTAYYAPFAHLVSIAELKYYENTEHYYKTLFHELIHSTGKVLKRKGNEDLTQNHNYSEEEIVAESGATLLMNIFGLQEEPTENSVEYLVGWSEKLRDNPNWLFKGISAAEKAVKYFCDTVGIEMEAEE